MEMRRAQVLTVRFGCYGKDGAHRVIPWITLRASPSANWCCQHVR